MHFLPENRMCAPPFATKQRPPILKILDPPLVIDHFLYSQNNDLKPDIFTFQETHSMAEVQASWANEFGRGYKVFMSHGTNASKGVLLGFAPHLNVNVQSLKIDKDGQFIVANVTISGEPFTVIAVYLPPNHQVTQKLDTLNTLMSEIAQSQNTRVIWCGDFNMVLDKQLDIADPSRVASAYRINHRYNEFFESHDWTDTWRALHPTKRRFTCCTPGSLSRADFAMASPAFLTHLIDVEIGTAYASDHSPIFVQFSLDQLSKGPGYWRMPNYLLSDPVFTKKIENLIDNIQVENPTLDPMVQWDLLKTQIRQEGSRYVSMCRKQTLAWTAQVEEDIRQVTELRDKSARNPSLIQYYAEKVKMLQIERDDLITSRNKKARDYNIARKHYESNRPTKYYYRLPGTKYDDIKQLRNKEGQLVSDSKSILTECHNFYGNLYTKKPHPLAMDEDLQWKFLQHIPAVMQPAYYVALDQDITKHEMYSALTKMKQDAAPGFDGLTVRFYLKFWHKIGDLMFQSVQHSFQVGKLSASQCRGIIRLIPKKAKDPLQVHNWRPITLLNVDYKIISKLLALRLATILPDLIGKDQRGFVRGRYVGDNVYELYSLLTQAELDGEDGFLMQLDIEKAFDSVSWSYLEEVLYNFNFPLSFIQWVTTLYAEKEMRIINNGHTSSVIFPTNGLVQGDSLSPLLFVLVIETLALNLRANDQIVGFHFKEFHKKLSMLADDMILSLKAKQTTVSAVLETLQEFAKISNLMVNLDKSAVYPIGPHRNLQAKSCDITPFKWSTADTLSYLGVKTPLKVFFPQMLLISFLNLKCKITSIQRCQRETLLIPSSAGKIMFKHLLVPR